MLYMVLKEEIPLSILESALWASIDNYPDHLQAHIKRNRYRGEHIPKVGDLVTCNHSWYPGQPAMITKVDVPTVYFTYPDGKEGTSGIRGIKVLK